MRWPAPPSCCPSSTPPSDADGGTAGPVALPQDLHVEQGGELLDEAPPLLPEGGDAFRRVELDLFRPLDALRRVTALESLIEGGELREELERNHLTLGGEGDERPLEPRVQRAVHIGVPEVPPDVRLLGGSQGHEG